MSVQSNQLKGDFDAVRKDIEKILKLKEYDDGHIGPVLLRLAWHSSGTYDAKSDTGGSNGSGMRYESEGGDPANAGLQHARTFLEPIKEKHPWITYSDLWILAGVVAIKAMGGPDIVFKPGRSDFADEQFIPPRGRLPDGAQAADHLRHIFNRMGFNDQEIVALSGAHNLGRCHGDRSGFEGAWVVNPTRFSNQYYRLLLKLDWKKRDLSDSSKEKGASWQWSAAPPGGDEEDEPLMMLPTDHALIEDEGFRPWVEKYADDAKLFHKDFAAVFGKLIELGVHRDEDGIARFSHLEKGKYESAPKKSNQAGAPGKSDASGVANGVEEDNKQAAPKVKAKL